MHGVRILSHSTIVNIWKWSPKIGHTISSENATWSYWVLMQKSASLSLRNTESIVMPYKFKAIKRSKERTASGSPSPPHQNQKQNFSPPELKCPRTIIHPSKLSSPRCASSPDSLPRRQLLHSSRLRSKKHHDCPDSCTLPTPGSLRSKP